MSPNEKLTSNICRACFIFSAVIFYYINMFYMMDEINNFADFISHYAQAESIILAILGTIITFAMSTFVLFIIILFAAYPVRYIVEKNEYIAKLEKHKGGPIRHCISCQEQEAAYCRSCIDDILEQRGK